MVAVHREAADCARCSATAGGCGTRAARSNSPRRPLALRGATRRSLRASPPPKSPRPPPTHPWSPRWWS